MSLPELLEKLGGGTLAGAVSKVEDYLRISISMTSPMGSDGVFL